MKKIAILTQPLHTNYGGNLQNFALQTVLKKMGHEPITIDRHHNRKLTTKFKLGYFKRIIFHYSKGTVKPKLRDYFSKSKDIRNRINIVSFIEKYINKTPRLYSDKSVKNFFLDMKFDVVVVGSDQCWRPIYSPNINTYFLDFLEDDKSIKKLAYAASFGTDEWELDEKQTCMAKRLIKTFDAVSVREKQAVKIMKNKLNTDAKFVLDPTLLLDKYEYLKLIEDYQALLPENKGIYTYLLDTRDWKDQVLNQISDSLGANIFNSQPKATVEKPSDNPDDYIIPSVECWLKGFNDAEFVVTDSFHGTVFAILFNKPFVSLLNADRGGARLLSLLCEFGLEDRLVAGYDECKINNLIYQYIDYPEINKKLKKLKKTSEDFLMIN